MRAFLLLLSVAACSGASSAPSPLKDAGHEDAAGVKDSGPDVEDAPVFLESGTPCDRVGAIWAKMDHQPILLADPKNQGHRTVAGVDMDGAAGKGTTIGVIESLLCHGTALGAGPGGTRIEGWGVSNEVRFAYDPGMFFVEGVALFPGYFGVMTLPTDPAGPDAGHTFTVGLGPILMDGATFLIDWTDHQFVNGNVLYNALQYNSADYPGYGVTPCGETGACTVTTAGTKRQWSIDAAAITLTFDLGSTEAVESTVVEIDMSP